MAFVEVVADKAGKTAYDSSSGIGGKLQAATRKRGLITRCSDVGIAIAPPLVISSSEVDELVSIVSDAINEVCV
jgi:adenosylmethionine-8-amino-7-oxononanoate aminotransferase